MNLTILIASLSLAIAVNTIIGLFVTKKKYLLYSTAILLAVAMLFYSHSYSALAAADAATPGAINRFVSEEQQELEEDLNLTPGGGHYSGIEYAERAKGEAQPVSDEVIQETIEEYRSDNLTIAVANGSVRVSGRVQDKDVARHVIEQIKEIPGVHEITFDLGLENKAT